MGLRYNVEMSGAHLRYFFFTLTAAAAVLFAARSHGQQTFEARTFLYPYSLPAVDQGIMGGLTPDPATAAAFARRAGASSANTLDRTGSGGSTYVAGRVIVKFRDGASTAARIKSLSLVSATAAVPERPSYANFDLVRIDPGDDAEAVAAALAERPD